MHFRLNSHEASLLEKMMKEIGYTNISAFIKYKIFGMSTDYAYRKMLQSADKSDIEIVMKNLMNEMNGSISYLNYRFDYELEQIAKSFSKSDEKSAKRIALKMGEWKEAVMKKTDQIYSDCQEILKFINIKVERNRIESIRFAPGSIIDKAGKDWDDITSPEALEGARRDLEEFDRKQENIRNNR